MTIMKHEYSIWSFIENNGIVSIPNEEQAAINAKKYPHMIYFFAELSVD